MRKNPTHPPTTPKQKDLAQLTYARQCTQESLRIYTIAPLVPRFCAQETKLACGVTVPAGVEVRGKEWVGGWMDEWCGLSRLIGGLDERCSS